MGKNKKMIAGMAAAFLILCILQGNTVYAKASSQLQPTDEAHADTVVQDTSETTDTNEGGSSIETSDQNEGESSAEESGQDESEPSAEESGQDESDPLKGSEDEQVSDGSQSTDEWTDGDQEVLEDDDEWADGEDEWTDAWTGVDDDMADGEWADDKEKNNDARITRADSVESIESYDGGEEYIAENSASNISSKSYYERADVNYQTGAGLGDDILLIAAVLCGITAIGLTARKCMHKK